MQNTLGRFNWSLLGYGGSRRKHYQMTGGKYKVLRLCMKSKEVVSLVHAIFMENNTFFLTGKTKSWHLRLSSKKGTRLMAIQGTTHNVLQMPERSTKDRLCLGASFDFVS
jgi:hypothetical protein